MLFKDVDLEEESDDSLDGEEADNNIVDVDVKIEGEEAVKVERERWSEVWKYFVRLPIGPDGRERAKCKKCPKGYICETRNGTGSLRTHVKKYPRRDKNDIAQLIVSGSGGSLSMHSTVFKYICSSL
jgi:hypothetical protein